MERGGSRERGLQDLQPTAPARRTPRWVAPSVAFVLALLATIVVVGVAQPFHSAADSDAVAYERGFAAGQAAGLEDARLALIQADADAYRRGRAESDQNTFDTSQGSLTELLRQVGSGEVDLVDAEGEAAVFARGYEAGYRAGSAERQGS